MLLFVLKKGIQIYTYEYKLYVHSWALDGYTGNYQVVKKRNPKGIDYLNFPKSNELENFYIFSYIFTDKTKKYVNIY